MCGIAGLVLDQAGPIRRDWIRSLLRNLEHRGPDDSGVLTLHRGHVCLNGHAEISDDPVAEVLLVHRRLAILDLSRAGWQPMRYGAGRYYVVFNGEIYNYIELRAELVSLGHRFGSNSDTEVLVASYVEWGAEALSRLIGMFAFAILDVEAQKLFLARDCFGIKPLYYAQWQQGIVFASELRAILEFPGVSRRINPQRLYDYLRFGITDYAGETLFSDIRQVPAAHFIELSLSDRQEPRPVRYWHIDLSQRAELSFDDAARRVRELFLENVRLHLRSDVPVGAALSGGIDSSAIVMAMRHVDPDLKIHSFSYIADDAALSEEQWVDTVGEAANASVHKVRPQPDDLVADLETLIRMQGECFGSTSIYAQRRVFQCASEAGIKVMLDGQGADEMLGGYSYYVAARLGSLLRQGKIPDALRLLKGAAKLPGLGMFWLWAQSMDFLLPVRLQRPFRALISKDLSPSWLNSEWFYDRGVGVRSPSQGSGADVLRTSLHRTIVETTLPALLRYEDRNSMSFSIESRVPFLTPDFVAFVLSLPEDYIIAADGTSKAVFRRAMRGIVPDVILDRKDKIGFVTPEREWLLTLRPWVERILSSDAASRVSAINIHEVQREWQGILRGNKRFDFRVWRWLNVVLWAETFSVDAR